MTRRLCFMGNSHAQRHLSEAAVKRGFTLASIDEAEIIFVSQDTPTAPDGKRDMTRIRELAEFAAKRVGASKPIVITSQCEPGFTRSLGIGAYHQAETLRIRDAAERALNPEQIIVGSESDLPLPDAYADYCYAWECPVLRMSLEEAEFAKIAINTMLAAQVDCTNRLADAVVRLGLKWEPIRDVLRHDRRIGRDAYLTPGRWQESPHLVRDAYTLDRILG